MGSFDWHLKGRKSGSKTPRISIGFIGIKLNPGFVEKYVNGEQFARVAYDSQTQQLAILPTHSTDRKHGLKVQMVHGGGYISCPSFIKEHRLFDTGSKGTMKYYDIVQDHAERCIVVKGVKQFGSK